MRRSLAISASIAVVALVAVCALPSPAHATNWVEGTATKDFSLAKSGGLIVTTDTADPSLVVPYSASTLYDGSATEFEPRSVRVLADGSILVTTGKHGSILHISKDGRILRQYTSADIPGIERPFDAMPMPDGGMLIVDRSLVQEQGRIIRVDSALNVIWTYGGTSGFGADQLTDPFTAQPLPGGHTLIADSLGFRVIEIDDASGAVVWSYGTFGAEGPGPGLLRRPHGAQRLDNGNTLICDSELHKVIEVTPAKSVVWSYGTGTAGSGPGQLNGPNSATRLANGNTLICDTLNSRVIEVDSAGRIVEAFGAGARVTATGALNEPRAAVRLADGSTLIADLGNERLATYRYAPRKEWVAESAPIDPFVAARKRFVSIKVGASVPTGAHLGVEYSVNSGAWTYLSGTKLPSDTTGTNIRYRLRLTTGAGDAAPVVRDVSIEWVVAASATTSTTTGASGTTSGSGVATSSAPGGTTEVAGGASDLSGGSGAGLSSAVSGWVMSEVQDTVATFGDASSTGAGTGKRSSPVSTTTGMALLAAVYIVGLLWTPAGNMASGLLARIVTTSVPK